MSLTLFVDDTCPKCRKTILHSYIEPHPTRRDLAVHKLDCTECGAVEIEIISLSPGVSPAGLAA
jgi:hypothetical protein